MPLKRECLVLLVLSWIGSLRAQDENRVLFSLGTFQKVNVPVNRTVQAIVSQIPANFSFMTLQFHTQYSNVTLSYSQVPVYGSSVMAVDAGLLSTLNPNQTSLSWFLNSPDGNNVAGVAMILPYNSTDPVPGACNLVFPLEIDPNIYLQYNLVNTTITFAPANIGYERGKSPPACDVDMSNRTRRRLIYEVYQYFLPERDLSEQTLISVLEKVANMQNEQDNSRKVDTLTSQNLTKCSYASQPGQGVIYSVIVRDPSLMTSASYVPVHTYACSFNSKQDACSDLVAAHAFVEVYFTSIGLAGLLVCFVGHHFFKCEMFCLGFGLMAFIFFVVITTTTTLDYVLRLALTSLMGVIGGVVLLMSWWRFGSVKVFMPLVGLPLGFLIASVVFFTPMGDLSFFQNDVAYWVVFVCIMMVPVVSFYFIRSRECNIVACAVVGAYTVVLAVDAYTYTTLSYITLKVLKRMLSDNRPFILGPLQVIDYILITVWGVLAISGIILQVCLEKSQPPFPPSPYEMWKQERERRKTNVLDPSHHKPSLSARAVRRLRLMTRRSEPAGETTPLLF